MKASFLYQQSAVLYCNSIETCFNTIPNTNKSSCTRMKAVTVELVAPCSILRPVSCCIKGHLIDQLFQSICFNCQLFSQEISEWWHCLFMYCWSVGNCFVRKTFSPFRETSGYVLRHPSLILSTQCVSLFIVL